MDNSGDRSRSLGYNPKPTPIPRSPRPPKRRVVHQRVIVEEIYEVAPEAVDFFIFLYHLWKAIPSILIILFLIGAFIG